MLLAPSREPEESNDSMARPKPAHSSIQNGLLAKLSRADYARLVPHLEPIDFSRGDVVYEADEPQSHIYFPTTSVVCLVYTTKDGATAEIGLVGKDGVVGLALFMGGRTRPNRALVQVAGGALQAELKRCGPLLRLLLRYTQALLTQISQTAVCNGLHSVEQRLCRWLLLCDDRVRSGELALTQALLAGMLGVRREAVTAAARKLQAAKLIRYRRGKIGIVDRRGLENRACECYHVVHRETVRLLGDNIFSTRALMWW